MTTAATAVTVASVAFVSGLSRWKRARAGPTEKVGDASAGRLTIAQAVAPCNSPDSSADGSSSASSRSPCGKRAIVRRAMAETMR